MLKEIQQKTATKRSESIGHLLSPKPTIDILLYEGITNQYNDIILHRTDGKREVVTMRNVETKANPDNTYSVETLWYGVSSTGWLVYGYQIDTNVEYTKCFDSTDVVTTLAQYKKKFTGL
jgi:hypothetical protein